MAGRTLRDSAESFPTRRGYIHVVSGPCGRRQRPLVFVLGSVQLLPTGWGGLNVSWPSTCYLYPLVRLKGSSELSVTSLGWARLERNSGAASHPPFFLLCREDRQGSPQHHPARDTEVSLAESHLWEEAWRGFSGLVGTGGNMLGSSSVYSPQT